MEENDNLSSTLSGFLEWCRSQDYSFKIETRFEQLSNQPACIVSLSLFEKEKQVGKIDACAGIYSRGAYAFEHAENLATSRALAKLGFGYLFPMESKAVSKVSEDREGITEKQLKLIHSLMEELEIDQDLLRKSYKFEKLESLKKHEASQIISDLITFRDGGK